LNIDGTGLEVNNSGSILGSGAQRNGTVYADATANNFTLNNTGTIDAVVAGSGVAFQLGTADGDVRSFTLVNDGTIAGRGDAQASGASAGLRLFNGAGAGTTVTVADDIVNNGTISSDTGPALLIENIAFTGDFINNGTLTGPTAVDASTALSALNFVQNGGALNGNFVGSAFADTLNIDGPAFTLSGDVLGGVDVTTDTATAVTVSGARSIEGSLTSNGTLILDLGTDSIAVDGDLTLGAGSIVNVTTNNAPFPVGTAIDVLTETGAFTDNGVIVNVADDDFLVDYQINLGSLTITPTAADLSNISADSNINAFGGALDDAVAANLLPAAVLTPLNNAASVAEFEAAAVTLLPAINEGVTREIYETQNVADSFIADRLASGRTTGLWGQLIGRTANRDADSVTVTGYDADAFGFTIGVDFAASDTFRVGAAYSYVDIDVDQQGGGAEQSEIGSSQISAYFGYNDDKTFVNGLVGYSFNDVDTSRTSAAGPVNGGFDVDGIRAQVNAGYELGGDSISFVPYIGFNYANLSSDSYVETGGLGLTVDAGLFRRPHRGTRCNKERHRLLSSRKCRLCLRFRR